MLRSIIYQMNITVSMEESKKAQSFDNCLVNISENMLEIYNNEKKVLATKLKYLDRDFVTESYIGEFENEIPFRVIRPLENVLLHLKKKYNCIDVFSIAGLESDSYAVNFLLFNLDDSLPNLEIIDKGKVDQIQRLIHGSLIALKQDLIFEFADFTKRILKFISNTDELLEYDAGKEFIEALKSNKLLFNFEEQKKIKN